MKKTFLILVVILSVACNTEQQKTDQDKSSAKVDLSNDSQETITVKNNPKGTFDVQLQLEKLSNNEYYLAADLSLGGGAYVISPYSKDDTYLPFNITLPKNKYFTASKTLIESPASVEEMDPVLEKRVKFVRENTSYKQKLTLAGKEDFETSGIITFLLEPSCIPYDVEFTIVSKDEEMSISKTNTSIAAVYYNK